MSLVLGFDCSWCLGLQAWSQLSWRLALFAKRESVQRITRRSLSLRKVHTVLLRRLPPLLLMVLLRRLDRTVLEVTIDFMTSSQTNTKRLWAMYWTDSVTPCTSICRTTISKYVYDMELQPGAQPVRHQLPRMSPQQMEKEAYHLDKAEKLGHLRTPDAFQVGEWSTRTHIVFKKDDPNGRWICDFRFLNKATIKKTHRQRRRK